jgi:hypothetical protein
MAAGEKTGTPALTAATWFRRMRASPGESQIAAQFVKSCAPKHRSGSLSAGVGVGRTLPLEDAEIADGTVKPTDANVGLS